MVTDNNQNNPVPEEPTGDPLESFLKGYKDVIKEDTTAQQVVNDSVLSKPNTNEAVNQTVNKSDPNKFYQTGKKVGQPRPERKPSLTYNKTVDQTSLSGDILTGALFITLIDLLIPMVLAGINNRFSKQKIKASDLFLTQRQKNELSPIADKVVKQFDFNGNPQALLIYSMIGIYGANFAMLKFMNDSSQTKKENENTSKDNSKK